MSILIFDHDAMFDNLVDKVRQLATSKYGAEAVVEDVTIKADQNMVEFKCDGLIKSIAYTQDSENKALELANEITDIDSAEEEAEAGTNDEATSSTEAEEVKSEVETVSEEISQEKSMAMFEEELKSIKSDLEYIKSNLTKENKKSAETEEDKEEVEATAEVVEAESEESEVDDVDNKPSEEETATEVVELKEEVSEETSESENAVVTEAIEQTQANDQGSSEVIGNAKSGATSTYGSYFDMFGRIIF